MGARQSFSLESLAEASTTSADRQVNATLTFTPDADSDYWLIASGAFSNPTSTDDHVGHVAVHHAETVVDLLAQSGQNKEPSSPQDWMAFFGVARLSFGTAPGAQNIRIEYWSSHAGDTTKIKDARLLLLKADAADQWAASDGQSSTSLTTYQTKTTLTFSPANEGDYLLIATATVATDANISAMRVRLNHVGGTIYGDKTYWSKDDYDNQPYTLMERLTLPASAQTFSLQYRSNSGTLCYIRDARILALRLDAFDNVYFASNHASQTTTNDINTDFLTLTATPLALPHAIIAVGGYHIQSAAFSGYASIAKNGSTLKEWVREAPNGLGWQFAGLAQQETLAAASTTWTWRGRAEVGGQIFNIGNLAIAVLQLDATPPSATRRRCMAIAG